MLVNTLWDVNCCEYMTTLCLHFEVGVSSVDNPLTMKGTLSRVSPEEMIQALIVSVAEEILPEAQLFCPHTNNVSTLALQLQQCSPGAGQMTHAWLSGRRSCLPCPFTSRCWRVKRQGSGRQ